MLFENLKQIMNEHFENNVAPSSLPSSPPISPKPSTPNNSISSSSLSEQSTEVDTPIIERDPSPIPTPAEWRRVKEVQEAAKVLMNISHPTKALIGPPPRNPHRVPGWWQHLTLNQTLDPYLAAESVQNTLWSHTPVVTASRLTQLWTYLDAITWNLYSDQSAMQMEDFITTLSAVTWAEGDSKPVTCDASMFNSGHACITQTYSPFTELLKKHMTMRGKMVTCLWRISGGAISNGEELPVRERLRCLSVSMHQLKIK
ncbi:hypothetical protein B9Z19DRAFT_1069016 [Tuber borchii]|uniref:Uncharacterized protein n=1 Tax=Tuber borchii TaxID=42251 RepID=A0A2T6ZD45_TUBBO|nr:hypothetical protein B9Z19DRAFT_1069016 [Tuber borchii]